MFPIITISRVPSTGAQTETKKKHDVKTLSSEEAPLLFSLPFLPMISISNSPCFASELHACVHAITALQVVARPTSGVKKQPLCMHSHVCVCVCVFVPCLRECFFVERELTSYETQSKLRDRVVYKCYIIINFSVFVGFCFGRVTGH